MEWLEVMKDGGNRGGVGTHLGFFFKFSTPELNVRELFQTDLDDDMISFNFIYRAKPEGSASETFNKVIVKTGSGVDAG